MRQKDLVAVMAAGLVFLAAMRGVAQEDRLPEHFSPLRAQGGPVLSPALSAHPQSEIWVGYGMRFAEEIRGRATYVERQSRTVLGGEWSPSNLNRLGLGADLVAFQTTYLQTDLPPAINEENRFYDLGPLRLHAKFLVLELDKPSVPGGLSLIVTPFFRFGLPTDTSRVREERRMPVRTVVDDRVALGPYFLVEPGLSTSLVWGPATVYAHQGFILVPVHGQDVTHFCLSQHLGLGVRIFGKFEVLAELNSLLRMTRAYDEERLAALAFGPGVRFLHQGFFAEISARLGIGDDSSGPFGTATVFAALGWRFKKTEP